jgi:hypothetical protein
MVAAMLEEASSVPCCDCRDRYPQCFDQGFAGPGLSRSQKATFNFEKASSMGLKPGEEYGCRR